MGTIRSHKLVSGALALAGVAATVGALAVATAGAHSIATRDITVNEKTLVFTFTDAPPKMRDHKLSIGDHVLSRQAMFEGKARVGTLFLDCSSLGPTSPIATAWLQCTATYRFKDGEIIVTGTEQPGGHDRAAIVGGTGAYIGAKGEIESREPAKGFDSTDVLHLAA
jgi:hypothetical protein